MIGTENVRLPPSFAVLKSQLSVIRERSLSFLLFLLYFFFSLSTYKISLRTSTLGTRRSISPRSIRIPIDRAEEHGSLPFRSSASRSQARADLASFRGENPPPSLLFDNTFPYIFFFLKPVLLKIVPKDLFYRRAKCIRVGRAWAFKNA